MTLLSVYEPDDSRNAYKILADQAVKYIDHPEGGSDAKILFTNLARLLERYRYDAFYDYSAPGILEVLDTQHETRGASDEGSAKTLDVIPALETAHATVYGSLPKGDLVPMLQSLLLSLATCKASDEVRTRAEFQDTRRFFFTLAESLKERHA